MRRPGFSLRFGRYRFAPSLWPSVAFFLLLPVLLSLGFWQMERAVAKQALVEQRVAGGLERPIDLNRVSALNREDRYRTAVVRGRYRDEQQWLLDNRVYRGQAGYHVFTPFIPEGETQPRLLINRGWVSVGETREFLPQLPVPEALVELSGRLDTPASVGIVMGEPPVDSVESRVRLQSLDIGALRAARGLPLADYALVIDEGLPGGLQYDWSPVPQMGPEKHLGYAVQWFGLAVALTIIYVGVNTRRGPDDGGDHVRA
jgi:surfeit locus 1 family protein